MSIEYRVRPVTRYIVTRYNESGPDCFGCEDRGEFQNEMLATIVRDALADKEESLTQEGVRRQGIQGGVSEVKPRI
jgi:hypothetical protein